MPNQSWGYLPGILGRIGSLRVPKSVRNPQGFQPRQLRVQNHEELLFEQKVPQGGTCRVVWVPRQVVDHCLHNRSVSDERASLDAVSYKIGSARAIPRTPDFYT